MLVSIQEISAETDKLPPTEGAFIQHVKRAFYQLSIGEQAMSASISHKSPDDYGWETKDGKWIPITTDN